MIKTYLISMFIILCLLAGWVAVQHLARLFAARHPEFGPAREEGGGCGALLCLCNSKDACPKNALLKKIKKPGEEPEKL